MDTDELYDVVLLFGGATVGNLQGSWVVVAFDFVHSFHLKFYYNSF